MCLPRRGGGANILPLGCAPEEEEEEEEETKNSPGFLFSSLESCLGWKMAIPN